MTGRRLTEIRMMLDLTQEELGRLLGGVNRVTVTRWENRSQEFPVPVPVAMALELIVACKIAPGEAYRLATGEEFQG